MRSGAGIQLYKKPLPGMAAPRSMLVDLGRLEREYYERRPELEDPDQLVRFGIGGHRGSPLRGAFNEAHMLAITQAICDYRRENGIHGPLYLGKDTHAISGPAQCTALEVLAANGVETIVHQSDGFTPAPVISRAILVFNRSSRDHCADGIVITPSQNPPDEGGLRYNTPDGGPAGAHATNWIETRANRLLGEATSSIRRLSYHAAIRADTTHHQDLVLPYVRDLRCVIDIDAIRAAKLKLAVDPLGGASMAFWAAINATYCLNIAIVNPAIDPTFSFMTLDHDGVIRMDCSSSYATARLVELKDRYQVAFANDPAADRHGIVTPSAGLMNSNHFLSCATHYLLDSRDRWNKNLAIGKTVVTTSMVDKVARKFGHEVHEVPVGFRWFTPAMLDGHCCFGGDESAGATFLRQDGAVWTTDKDGLIMNLLAAEVTAWTGKDPSEHYKDLTAEFGTPHSMRIDCPATQEQKAGLRQLSTAAIRESELAGEPISEKLTRAPGNGVPIQGLKVVTKSGWFVVRPSETEDLYKIHAESFAGQAHLNRIVEEAQAIVKNALAEG